MRYKQSYYFIYTGDHDTIVKEEAKNYSCLQSYRSIHENLIYINVK